MDEGRMNEWLGMREEGILLQGSLDRVSDLLENPCLADQSTVQTQDDMSWLDESDTDELCRRIQVFARNETSSFKTLVQYRTSALTQLWRAKQKWRESEKNSSAEETTGRKSYGNSPTDGSSSFSSKLSLMLIFPLIESQARLDPGLCSITTTILLQSLRECPPLSLREPADCLTGLENLLCRWLGEESSGIVRLSPGKPCDEIVLPAACLVALACASNSTRTVLHTLYMLNQLKTVQHLPVNDIIYILSALEGGPSVPPVLQGARYKTGFWFEDPLPLSAEPPGSEEGRRTIATDGTYLFLTGLTGCGLAKLGSGLNGTFQGFIYAVNTDLGQGFISFADGVLLHKSLDQEKQGKSEYLATVLNPDTLEVKTKLTQSACLQIEAGSAVTINLISNGMEFYWIRAINPNLENGMSSPFAYIIILDVFTIDKNSYAVKVMRPRVVLSKREEPGLKLQGLEHIISRKSKPLRRSSAVDIDPSVSVPQTESSTAAASVANLARVSANLARVSSISTTNSSSSSSSTQAVQVAPGAANSTNSAKDTNSTSLGISYKTLVSAPMLTCGTFITILSPVVNSQSAGAQIARSLLGGNHGSSNRVLATSHCFSTRDGQFSSKHDFLDCINSSLGRGGTLSDFATVFDTVNNCIWGATGDHVDQFSNPGHQAPAFIARKLGFPEESTQAQTKKGNLASTQQIYATLLRHVGLQCSHAVASEKVAASCSGSLDSTLNQRAQDLAHFHRVLFLLEAAVSEGDGTSISCLLVSLQAFFNRDRSWAEELEKSRIKQLQELLWSIIDNHEKFSARISLEACETLLSALNMVYPSLQVQEELVLSLLNQETSQLRVDLGNMILERFTQELEAPGTQPNRLRQMLGRMRLNSCIISLLTLSTQKTISLIRTGNIEDVGQLCAEAPRLSPAVKYTATVVNTVLSNCLVDEDEDEDKQDLLRELIQLILDSSSSIIDHLLTEIQEMVSTDSGCLRLKYLERVLQGSILALVLLPTLTCLTQIVSQGDECEHCNIPVLVSLLTRCCKVSKIYQDHIKKGETGLEIPEKVDEGILSSVRIPTPWTLGRVLESPHPLKDNYKLKETVQIPGAKLLYIRFDPKCATQYDYDKLVIYAGSSVGSRKVSEYGGNVFGFGSRSVLGSGWPRDPIKVEGDTVTLVFEMRSGREHNTPDRAIWGFKVRIVSHEPDENRNIPLLPDITLTLTVLLAENLNILYNGKKISAEEEECKELLNSKLLQRCSWEKPRLSSARFCGEDEEIPRIKLPQDQVRRLRDLSGMRIPHMRQSVKEVIEPDVLEEAVLSAVLKHLGLGEILDNFCSHEAEYSFEYFTMTDIMMETYQKLYALIRKLQTIAELENHVQNDVEDIREKRIKIGETFYANYGHDDSSLKDLALICFIKDVEFDDKKPQKSLEELNKAIEAEAFEPDINANTPLNKTAHIVHAILMRVELLLQVSIDTAVEKSKFSNMMSRSLQSWPSVDSKSLKKQLSFDIEQSLDDSILQIPKLRLKRKIRKIKQSAAQLNKPDEDDKLPQTVVLEQLFQFIGSHPEQAVSPWKFLEAVGIRRERSVSRKYALTFMKELLKSAVVAGGGTYLVNSIAFLIQSGPRLYELTCGGFVEKVREAYGEIMILLVHLSSKFPLACKGSIGILCTVPYERYEEKGLVRSGLVNLLDKLCSQDTKAKKHDENKQYKAEEIHNLSSIAWAGFKVLTNRCMKWQEEESNEVADELKIIGLAHQVSILLTNNLARATDTEKESTENEALQEILQMLNNMSSSKMGKDILSQPSCVSKLLSLLLEPKLSPKMILTIIQLCHSALPLMSPEGFSHISLPHWTLGQEEVKINDLDPPKKIISLIFAKLADFLIPGCQISATSHGKTSCKLASRKTSTEGTEEGDALDEKDIPQDLPDMDRTLSLFIHKREDQSANEIVQQLLNASSEIRIFRFTGPQNMEKIVLIDKELNKYHRAEVITDDATVILRRAVKLAQQGFIVSVGTPLKLDELTEEKKNAVEQIAKDRNVLLSKFDPARPFISSPVANSMACELIALIHSLFRSSTANLWETAINEFISDKLVDLSHIATAQDSLFSGAPYEIFEIYNKARDLLAVLASLGGYTEFIKPGICAKVSGQNMDESTVLISSISEQTGQAQVQFNIPNDVSHFPRPSNTILVPLQRIKTLKRTDPVQLFLPLADELIASLQSLLAPDPTGVEPLSTALPAHGEGRSLKLATSRLIAELRTRAMHVMSLFLEEPEFGCKFMQASCQAVDMLKCLSKDCLPSDRIETVEAATRRLRNLYRDCVKPPAPPSRRNGTKHKVMIWDSTKTFPPLRSVLFTHNMLGITYYSEPVLGTGAPRGIFVYGNQMIPQSANFFYWEIDILSLGDTPDDSGTPLISVGFAPLAEKKDGPWSNPVGSMLFHSNGRVVHYNGSSLLQWRSLRFDSQLNPGDIIGIGWEKVFEASGNIPSSGTVFFTLNGVKLDQGLEEVAGNMFPVVHVQKKNTRIKANFGNSKFAFAEGRKNFETSLDETNDENDSSDGFGNMPFHTDSDSSGASSPERGYELGAGNRRINTYACRTALTPKPLREYNLGSEEFKTQLGNELCSKTGSHIQPITVLDEDSDSEDEDEDDLNLESGHREDINSLLVKSWETKVFPIIRRRFRNEAERKDGLEQIKGALSLGMADIARQTVEFLYEENGGVPRDLHLPTIEDVKEEMSKFTIERLKKGQQVIISEPTQELTTMPKFAVPTMMKTFGLPGEVLEIDPNNELVQVESYLKSEGVLVRFWYPISVLEKPSDCNIKVAVTGAQVINVNNLQIHKELMSWEFAMSRLYCRESYVKLIEHSRNDDFVNLNPVEETTSAYTMITSNMLLLKDIDVENLQYISNHCLMTPENGNVLERNINIKDSHSILNLEKGKLSNLFFDNFDLLKMELNDFIVQASQKGEDYMLELTNQTCMVLQLAPELFSTEEVVINDISTLNSCILFPGAAFTAASIRIRRGIEESSELKDLTIQLQTLDSCYVKYNGQISSRDIIQYPIETNGYKDPLYSAFTPVIMATDKVRVSHSGGEDLGIRLYLHSIPQQLPLATAYIEQILVAIETENVSKYITKAVIFNLIEVLSGFFWRYEMPQEIKERLFLLLAELIRCYKGLKNKTLPELNLPQMQLYLQFQNELRILYDYESSRKLHKRFSSYIQSLFELSTAFTDLTDINVTPVIKKSRSPTPVSGSDKEGSPTPASISSSFRRRLRPRRSRLNSSGSNNSDSGSTVNMQDKFWYTKLHKLTNVLWYVVDNDISYQSQATDLIKEGFNQTKLDDFSRLLILKGVPKHLERSNLISILNKILVPFGGAFKSEIYLHPLTESNTEPATEAVSTTHRPRTTSTAEPVQPNNSGYLILQVRSRFKSSEVKQELLKNPILSQPGEFDIPDEFDPCLGLCVYRVTSAFNVEDPKYNFILDGYLKTKIFDKEGKLRIEAYNALEDIFISSYLASQRFYEKSEENDNSYDSAIHLKQGDILVQTEGNLIYSFFFGIKQTKRALIEGVKEVLEQYGSEKYPETGKENEGSNSRKSSIEKDVSKVSGDFEGSIVLRVVQEFQASEDTMSKRENNSFDKSELKEQSSEEKNNSELGLELEGFIRFICAYAEQDIRSVWIGLQSCGFDLLLERVHPTDIARVQSLHSPWNRKQDEALIEFGNMIGRTLNISPMKISPNEIYLTESDLSSILFSPLQAFSVEEIRSRYCFLKQLNLGVAELLPMIDFRAAGAYSRSIGSALSKGRKLIFYDVKETFLKHLLDSIHQRNPDHAPPEIVVDPVEEIGNTNEDVCSSLFCQALNQLAEVQSCSLNVSVAAGGDPQYPFNIKMAGDEVHGNSGSFRHFLSAVVEQLHGPTLNLLVPYRGTGPYTGRYFLKPGPTNYGEEKMLQFFGQLLGISMRAGIPLPLDLMPTFWMSLVNQPLLSWTQSREIDPVTFNYVSDLESVTEDKFDEFLEENNHPKFTLSSIGGGYVELCPEGVSRSLCWDNLEEYVNLLKTCRLKEWESRDRITHIQAGLGSIVPITYLFHTFTAQDIELKLCGIPQININYLRQHTLYQVGISESDEHVQFFWSALESFNQEELGRFVKFACNQDRIPMSQDEEGVTLPPYPMKIAPPDRREGDPDAQYIRVETCMFMVKLPRYSTYESMREKLLYAITCALDPLSG